MHRWQPVPGCLFLFLFLLIGCHVEGSPVASRHTLATSVISKRNDNSRSAEAVTVLVTHGIDDDARQLRLNAVFSRTGNAYETQGDVAQMHMFRACEAKEKGFDHTLRDHIAVVFVDELIPGLTGCVNLENQARFAAKSGALALVVGPSNRIDKQELMKNQTTRIPVVLVDEMETPRLKAELERAAKDGQNARITLQFVEIRSAYTLRLHVFRPTLLNLALIGILVLLVIFITGLVFVKIRWRSDSHRDIWLRALARSALNKMEIRKFEKVPTSSDSLKENVRVVRVKRHDKSFLPVFGSLSSVAHTSTGQDRCSICLEEYSEGAELRVLFCGHEFHPNCVDPWLLAHRRCPLCQFDVVYKEYPQPERPPLAKTTGTQTHIALSEASQQEVPLLAGSSAATSTVFVEMAPLPSPHHRAMSNAPRTRLKPEGSPRGNMPSSSRARSTSGHRRRPLRPRHALVPTLPPPGPYPGRAQPVCVPPMVCIGTSNAHAQPIGTISGYSSDVSSYPDGPTLVDDFGVPQRIPL